jgi:ABC-type glycerol-3-phosphate transport system substrate-binding protein
MQKTILNILVSCFLVSILYLSGCIGEESTSSPDLNKFYGEWKATENDMYTFNEDGTCTYSMNELEGGFTVQNGKLSINLNNGASYEYTYIFLHADTVLSLTHVTQGYTVNYTKQ